MQQQYSSLSAQLHLPPAWITHAVCRVSCDYVHCRAYRFCAVSLLRKAAPRRSQSEPGFIWALSPSAAPVVWNHDQIDFNGATHSAAQEANSRQRTHLLCRDCLACETFSFFFFKLYANNMLRHTKQLLFCTLTFLCVTLVQFGWGKKLQHQQPFLCAWPLPLTKINVS